MTPDISGYWHGVLDTGSGQATLTFKLDLTEAGGTARLRTRTYGDLDLPIVRCGERLRFTAAMIDVALELRPDRSAERLIGDCRHAGASFPMTCERGVPPTAPRAARPQTLTPPFAYQTQAVSFDGADGSRLAGMLTTPSDQPQRGAVILSTWHGRVDRDQHTFGHRPFAIWADVLTRLGLATLRYDKRGAGESSGAFDRATTADFAADLARAVAFVRDQPGVDPSRVGLLGHSEGAHISADVAASDPGVAFCIMLTPSGVQEEATFETELFRAAKAVGGTPLHPSESIRLALELAGAGRSAAGSEEAVARWREILGREAEAGRFWPELVEPRAQMAASPWRRYWWNYDQTASLRALTCSTLVVFAGCDLQTPPSCHAPNVRAALAANRLASLVELPGLNHFLQQAKTGAPSEYRDIDETLSPEVIETVCGWVSETIAVPESEL